MIFFKNMSQIVPLLFLKPLNDFQPHLEQPHLTQETACDLVPAHLPDIYSPPHPLHYLSLIHI